jgi:hypothetical protein
LDTECEACLFSCFSGCLANLECETRDKTLFRRLQAQVEEEQALRKRALDQLTAGGRASRQAQAVEAAAEEDGVRRRKGPDASRLSFETQDDAGESGEGE